MEFKLLNGECVHQLEFEIFKIKLKYRMKLEDLEKHIKQEISEIIDGINEYSIKDYINKIKYNDDDLKKIEYNLEKAVEENESDLEKAVEEKLNVTCMFKQILEELKIGIKSFGEIIAIKM